jgi:AcrR family transcriptional regulator
VSDGAGLRERKKMRAREAIRREAFRLFTTRGFAATTVEQIAAAADVSPRTLFRYYPTKDAIVLADAPGTRFADAVRAQPPSLGALEAVAAAIRETFGDVGAEEAREQVAREMLVNATAELGAVTVAHLRARVDDLADALSHRLPGGAGAARHLAGAVTGIMLAADLPGRPTDDAFVTRVEQGLHLLRR